MDCRSALSSGVYGHSCMERAGGTGGRLPRCAGARRRLLARLSRWAATVVCGVVRVYGWPRPAPSVVR